MLSGDLSGKETQKRGCRTSLGAQWVCIHLPVQAKWLPSLVREHSPWRRAAEPMGRGY